MFIIQNLQTSIPLDIDGRIVSLYEQLKAFNKDLLIGYTLPKTGPSEFGNEINKL